MTKDTNGSGPELIVLGRDEAGKPRAAGFPAGHDGLVVKAAKAMGLTVCTAESADVAELAKKLPPGRLYSTGRGFVPAVGRSLYGKLVEQLKLAGQPVPGEAEQPNGDQSGTAPAAPGLPTGWDDVAVGHLVIAQESLAANIYDDNAPLALPGMVFSTSPNDYALIKQMQLIKFDGSTWKLFGSLISGAMN